MSRSGAIGAQRVMPGRQVVTLTGGRVHAMSDDGEMAERGARRVRVKLFVMDNQEYKVHAGLDRRSVPPDDGDGAWPGGLRGEWRRGWD